MMTTTITARTADRYSTGAMWFHWTIAALVIVNLVIGLLHENLLDGVTWAIPLHKSFGISVLIFTIGRILWRIVHPAPPFPDHIRGWERIAAHSAHWGLYALILIMPLSGWAMSSGSRKYPISFFGLFDVPYLPVSQATGGVAHNAHGLFGWVMLALVAIHIAAALRHHFLLRDHVLGRMAPVFDRR